MAVSNTWDYLSGGKAVPDTGLIGAGTVRVLYFPNHDLDFRDATFTAPTFLNSWANYDANHAQAGYYKDPIGFVHLRGLLRSGTIGAAMFTLPAGYRPSLKEIFPAWADGAFARLDVNTAGDVLPISGNNASWSISGATFYAGW